MPGVDPNFPSVKLDIFPSDIVSNLAVVKTPRPDLPGNFAGGLLLINTDSYPAEQMLKVGRVDRRQLMSTFPADAHLRRWEARLARFRRRCTAAIARSAGIAAIRSGTLGRPIPDARPGFPGWARFLRRLEPEVASSRSHSSASRSAWATPGTSEGRASSRIPLELPLRLRRSDRDRFQQAIHVRREWKRDRCLQDFDYQERQAGGALGNVRERVSGDQSRQLPEPHLACSAARASDETTAAARRGSGRRIHRD